jgi:large subunit ribosomal protein L31
MKPEIHPEYKAIHITCSCGNNFDTRSTRGDKSYHVDVCSKCHPFYTGQSKVMDAGGQVEKFRKRFGGQK